MATAQYFLAIYGMKKSAKYVQAYIIIEALSASKPSFKVMVKKLQKSTVAPETHRRLTTMRLVGSYTLKGIASLFSCLKPF